MSEYILTFILGGLVVAFSSIILKPITLNPKKRGESK